MKKKLVTPQEKLMDLFSEESYIIASYKNGDMALQRTVERLLSIKKYTTKELCDMLDLDNIKDKYNVDYCRRVIKNGKFWNK